MKLNMHIFKSRCGILSEFREHIRTLRYVYQQFFELFQNPKGKSVKRGGGHAGNCYTTSPRDRIWLLSSLWRIPRLEWETVFMHRSLVQIAVKYFLFYHHLLDYFTPFDFFEQVRKYVGYKTCIDPTWSLIWYFEQISLTTVLVFAGSKKNNTLWIQFLVQITISIILHLKC